jgi:hypothetical protein
MTEHGVILFHTYSAVMRAEKALGKTGLKVKPIPIPRQLSSDCGIALQFDWEELQRVEEVLVEARIETTGIERIPT